MDFSHDDAFTQALYMDENKFLLVKGIAGLCNRMLCALTGILYARLTGRRLIVDWSDRTYSDDGSNVFHRFFRYPLCGPDDEMSDTDSVSPGIWQGHLHESARHMGERYGNFYNPGETSRKFSIDLTKLDYQEDVLVMWTYNEEIELLRTHFTGKFKEFNQMSKEAILGKLLQEDLILHPEIKRRVNQFKDNYFGKKTVGVHVRYTDHRAGLWDILKRLDTLLKHEAGLQIFLATDNIRIKNMFEETYTNVITAPHWYPPPGLRLHGDKGCPSRMESGIEALVDLYLLAECDYLIIDTSSSFSYVAKLLTNAPDSNIYDVKRGEKRSSLQRRFIWQLMLKLGIFSWGLNGISRFVRMQKLFNGYRKRMNKWIG